MIAIQRIVNASIHVGVRCDSCGFVQLFDFRGDALTWTQLRVVANRSVHRSLGCGWGRFRDPLTDRATELCPACVEELKAAGY